MSEIYNNFKVKKASHIDAKLTSVTYLADLLDPSVASMV